MVAQPSEFWQNGCKALFVYAKQIATYQLWLVIPAPHQFPNAHVGVKHVT